MEDVDLIIAELVAIRKQVGYCSLLCAGDSAPTIRLQPHALYEEVLDTCGHLMVPRVATALKRADPELAREIAERSQDVARAAYEFYRASNPMDGELDADAELQTRFHLGCQMSLLHEDLAHFDDVVQASSLRSTIEVLLMLEDLLDADRATMAMLCGMRADELGIILDRGRLELALPPATDSQVRDVTRIAYLLSASWTPEGIRRWFKRPHPHLHHQAPQELISDPFARLELIRVATATLSPNAS